LLRFIAKSALFLGAFAFVSAAANAHMLPISYLTVVPDKTHVHVEFVVNPYELQFFSEVDKNHNNVLDPEELGAFERLAKAYLANLIEIQVGGKLIKADVAGANLAVGTHHVVIRAHYPVDARDVPISIHCNLWGVLRTSDVIIIKYINKGRTQSRLLESGKKVVTFDPAEKPR
jgi:hypothetical protein